MAVFLTRALVLAPQPGSTFTDTAGSWAEPAINALAAAGITSGCAPGRFCPTDPVTRAEMATFLYLGVLSRS